MFVRIQQPAKLVLNLLLGFFLVRLLPITGRPSSEGHAVTVQVCYNAVTSSHGNAPPYQQVPFSEFVVRAKRNQVRSVSIDGNQLTYWLRSNNAVARDLPAGADKMRISFQTVRPLDFPTPYETLVKNNVQFTAVDKRNNRFLNIMVRLCVCLCVWSLHCTLSCAQVRKPPTGVLLLRRFADHRTQPPAPEASAARCRAASQQQHHASASNQV